MGQLPQILWAIGFGHGINHSSRLIALL